MTVAPAALLLDAPMALYLIWVAFSVALGVVAVIWMFRPALAAAPLKRLGVVWIVLTLVVGLVSWREFGRHRNAKPHFAEAPNFSLQTVDGQSFSSDGLRGKVVLLEFWASWCVPCQESLPEMFRLYQEFKGPRFVMIGVSEDEDQSKFEAFVAQQGIRWPQDWDPKGQLAGRFSTNAIPSYAVIDADSRLRLVEKGHTGNTYFEIRDAILKALGTGDRFADARR